MSKPDQFPAFTSCSAWRFASKFRWKNLESQTLRPPKHPGFRVQLDFDASFNSHKTSLLGLSPQVFAALPPGLPKRLDPKHYRYAVVGLKDDTMGELIPSGSGVVVDVMQDAVKVSD
jgi:hypothetical protein